MNLLIKIQDSIAKHQLRRIKSKYERTRSLLRLNEAKKILIVYAWKDNSAYEQVQASIRIMQAESPKAHIEQLCYYRFRDKKLPEALIQKNLILLNRHRLNLFGLPKKALLTILLEKNYDLLADFTFNDYKPLLFTISVIRAKLKTGPDLPGRKEYYDLMIGLREGDKLKDFTQNLIHYLNIFKSN